MTDYAIAGPATISLQIFTAALAHRQSPVAPLADEAYCISERWGVNPAVALGFFVNESSAGTVGIATSTRNWGNLRDGPGATHIYQGFAWYVSFLVSLNDWCKLLRGPLYEGAGHKTVSQVTPVYAPGSDNNDPIRYAAVVNFLCSEWESMSQPKGGGTP
jgi:flagellum-specific peptidoglycan hydrolase FlgJ